jgi:hypothetical protein
MPERTKQIQEALTSQATINENQGNLNTAMIAAIQSLTDKVTVLEKKLHVSHNSSDSLKIPNSTSD